MLFAVAQNSFGALLDKAQIKVISVTRLRSCGCDGGEQTSVHQSKAERYDRAVGYQLNLWGGE